MLLATLSACQLTAYQAEDINNTTVTVSYSNYYLWLKSLSTAELLLEIKQQKSLLSSMVSYDDKTNQQENKLLLIYSLPNPAVYLPYKAKSLLNKYPLPNNVNNQADDNLAFMVMLRDQLNSQLHLLSKHTKLEATHLTAQANKDDEILRLKKQLAQLKAIEKNISKHQQTPAIKSYYD